MYHPLRKRMCFKMQMNKCQQVSCDHHQMSLARDPQVWCKSRGGTLPNLSEGSLGLNISELRYIIKIVSISVTDRRIRSTRSRDGPSQRKQNRVRPIAGQVVTPSTVCVLNFSSGVQNFSIKKRKNNNNNFQSCSTFFGVGKLRKVIKEIILFKVPQVTHFQEVSLE